MTNTDQDRGKFTSASAAPADALCAGRHLAQRDMPDTKSEDAAAGDRVHAALKAQDPTGLNVDDTEMYERCNAIEQQLLVKYFGPEIANLKAFPDREKRMWIGFVSEGLQHSGQADSVYRYKTKCLIVDYKTGRDEAPESPKNMQLRDLAVINWANRPLLQEIGVAIIQPWVTNDPELCVYDKAAIEIAGKHMLARIRSSNDPSSPRVAGELQCKYCKAKMKCDEYNKWAGSLVETVGMAVVLNTNVEMWSPDQKAVFLNNRGRAQKWLDEVEAQIKKAIEADPKAVPGWELKPGQNRESINNPQEVFDRASKLGLTLEQFMECIKVTKTDLKEQVAAATKQKGKALDKTMSELTSGCVEVKETSPTLKKVDA